MVKKTFLTGLFALALQVSFGQSTTFQDSVSTWFEEIKMAADQHQNLWKKNLYGPILLVDPKTRALYANAADSAGVLKPEGKIYRGVLPREVNIANTAVNWNGTRWAMIMLPLPVDKQDRINLLAHELFHVSQPALGFQLYNTENNHLDQKDGRIYLRLELEALKKALTVTHAAEQKKHLTHALTFRKYRYLLYPEAVKSENELELNEGIAEYTGLVLAERNETQTREHFRRSIQDFLKNPTFVRSFAYQTTPVYGYLLGKTKPSWNKEVNIQTNLTAFFIKKMNVLIPEDLKKTITSSMLSYNGSGIDAEEMLREEEKQKLIRTYLDKFVKEPHLELIFEQMNVSFDPRNILPLQDKGTVYPNIRVADRWGILTVTNGALMSNNWDKMSVSKPLTNENKTLTGDGWVLELKEGYEVLKHESTGNYQLRKK